MKPLSIENDPFTFFIYGASASVGMYTAQLVQWSATAMGKKLKLIGAASNARFVMLQDEPYNYDALVEYHDEDWPAQVRALANHQGVDFVYDCISEGATVRNASETLREGGRMAVVRSKEGGAFDTEGSSIEPIYGAVWKGLGVEVHYQNIVVATSAETRAFAVAFYQWLSNGQRLQPNPVRKMPGGLSRIVPDGFTLFGSGLMQNREHIRTEPWIKTLSAGKMVFDVIEEPAATL